LQLFREKLDEEYKELGFETPTSWSIKPITRDDVNKRVYNLGDKRLSQIFSEGEKNIHALADFFAEAEMNNYQGVYIFDDPVNSLDEMNREKVAERILRLVIKGNQVIIFTHDLVFLNMLIDTVKDSLHRVLKAENKIIIETNAKIGDKKELKSIIDKIKIELDRVEKLPITTDKELDMRMIYSLISGYLESYFEIVVLGSIISRYRPNIRMANILELKKIDDSILDKLNKLYDQTSIKGSRHSTAKGSPKPDLDQLKQHVKELETDFSY
jgi:ABC-type multidrug transport system ATPase subunit